jgi:hypothetical protein
MTLTLTTLPGSRVLAWNPEPDTRAASLPIDTLARRVRWHRENRTRVPLADGGLAVMLDGAPLRLVP